MLALFLAPPGAADPAVAEPAGYRLEGYRAPVPDNLAGATVVDTAGAAALLDGGAALPVDVLPRPPKPEGLRAGTIWRQPPRDNIPGSLWLPNTGYGALSESMARYFREALARGTGGERDRGLLFYCLSDCWMSWNAAKRALALGYRRVFWYPDGTDGWSAAGLPLERSEPVPPPE
ncbi:MAG: PQQ-dependent catabolism-associated CXXCW motif protein [Tistlia sp.]|uniref:PQQ-dependent catabolism-associated CXXCW motif protein n=1 Tax=Tistlia sp. TaxID=3057121 RepID=UPI0034A3CCDE